MPADIRKLVIQVDETRQEQGQAIDPPTRRAVAIAKGRAVLEASGNVTLGTVRAIAETGVDYISSGAITHSAANLDIGLDF